MSAIAALSAFCLQIVQLASLTGAALPPGYEDQLFCPPGRCMDPKKGLLKGFAGPASAYKVCVSRADDTEPSSPKGWGNKKPQSELKELQDGMWHSTTCEESEYVCNFGMDTSEWAICRVASHFLLKMIGELNGGDSKTVAHVRSMLAPYLGGPSGIAEVKPVGVPADFTAAKASEALKGLYEETDQSSRQRYETLSIDGASLAEKVLAGLKQDSSRENLLADLDSSGALTPREVTVQRVLFQVLDQHAWLATTQSDMKTRYAAGGTLLAIMAFLTLGAAAWRRHRKNDD